MAKPSNINVSPPRKPPTKDTDSRTQLETKRYELETKELEKNIKDRRTYAKQIHWLVITWLSILIAIILLQGFSPFFGIEFNLPENVLIAFVVSTTGTVLGLFVIVLKYLFQKEK